MTPAGEGARRRPGAGARRRPDPSAEPLVGPLPTVEVHGGAVSDSPLLEASDVDALVLPVAPPVEGDEGVQPRAGTVDAALRYGVDVADLAERLKARGTAGEAHVVQLPRAIAGAPEVPWSGLPPRVVLVGVGSGSASDLRRAGAAVARATRGLRRVVATVGEDAAVEGVEALVEGYLLAAYRHPTAARDAEPGPAAALVLLGTHPQGAVDAAAVTATAVWTARVLTATPSSTKTPAWLADRAAELARQAGLDVRVLGPEELERQGFGGLLAVGGGSVHPPRLVTITYVPDAGPQERSGVPPRHVVVVGKGITYDTGGLSIKPRESMVPMKTDMAGAAVALATVLGAAAGSVRHRVTAVLPLAENAVGGSSYRPGDVVRVFGGTTVEIANTDAEGRVVLADGLAYADAHLDPDVLVDVATLTGAATLGLGKQHGALYSPDDLLARAMEAAAQDAGEPLWRMPLVEEYRTAVRSDLADLRHVPEDGSLGGGSITAALFLQHFAGRRRWAHLDIAGPARAGSTSHEVPEGATGFGVRALLRWLDRMR